METCPFCWPISKEKVILESEHCAFINTPGDVLIGSGMIVPKQHRETVFDLSDDEISDTFVFLKRVKAYLDEQYEPDGYNVGWNCYAVGGQTVFHAHLHVIPRFKDEPLAGKGLRHHLKQKTNYRTPIKGK